MKILNEEIFKNLEAQARESSRLRSHHLLHRSHSDVVQRLLIGLVKGSYVEPHYHEKDSQWEMFVVLQGLLLVKVYSGSGSILDTFEVDAQNSRPQIVEFGPREIHSLECLSDFAVLLEVKEGPFDPKYAKAFPKWSIATK